MDYNENREIIYPDKKLIKSQLKKIRWTVDGHSSTII